MNTYRALTPAAVAMFDEGVFDAEFTASEEKDHLASGLLELVPRTYRVLSNNLAAGEQGSEIQAAYLVENEAALIQGGHIERVEFDAGEQDSEDLAAGDGTDDTKEED